MVELIKYLRFLAISSIILLASCDTTVDVDENTMPIEEESSLLLTREDSVLQLANDLNIEYDPETENINDVLDKVLIQKNSLLSRLDSLDERADAMESAAIQYKKKENRRVRNELLTEIDKIKAELERIKELSGIPDEVVKKDETSIGEVKVPEITSTFENLPSGNYVTRLNKYYIISIFVKPNGEIIFAEPRLDSTTVIKGGLKLNGRIDKELEQIRNAFKTDKN